MSTARTLAESTRPRVFNSEEETPPRLEGKVGENKWINSTTQNVCYAQRKTFRTVRNAGWRGGGVCSRSHVPRAACPTRRQLLHIKKNVKHPTEETGKRNHFHKNASEWPWKTYARLRGS